MKLIKFGHRTIDVDKIFHIVEHEHRDDYTHAVYLYIDIYIPGVNENGYIRLSKQYGSEDVAFDAFNRYLRTLETF